MIKLLSIQDVSIEAGNKVLVDRASFDLAQGKILGLAGGSGSGKTTIGLSILRLLSPALKITCGSIVFEGRNMLDHSLEEMRQIRGARIGMVFQEPLSAFDPLFTIGQQIDEVLVAHSALSKSQREKKVLETLSEMELSDPKRVYRSYPHQLSGGMRQRAMMAQAIVAGPSLIIADEPTSSLDVTLQAKFNSIFKRLKSKNISVLLITHDLGMIQHVADELVILCQGKIVEKGEVKRIYTEPQHAYTKELIEAFQ